jgi:phosphatidylethanolamine/phosphatidyl-N-methylethanolamine N-methyltransferase
MSTHSIGISIQNPSLCSGYLMDVARARAELDAGVQNVAFSCIDHLVHFVFQYVFFVFYPAYDRFYYEMQVVAFEKAGIELPAYTSWGFRETVLFIHRFISSPSDIGSIFPSSRGLVEAITKKVAEASKSEKSRRYLEIGAGTGPFTEGIIREMKPTDHLDLVEYDPEMCYLLKRKFRHLPNVTVHQISIFDYQAAPYDVVVSGLPLTNFPPDLVKQAHQKYIELTQPGGSFSYFEYIAMQTIGQAFKCGETAKKFAQVLALKAELEKNYSEEIDNVWGNITPARAIHCKRPASANA